VLLTIAIPTYNRPELLEESLRSAIEQETDLDYEILIADNCSSEENLNRVKNIIKKSKFQKIRLLESSENIGMYNNWNRCIEYASGNYLTILNDDDLLDKCFLKELHNFINGNQLVGCRSIFFGDLRWVEVDQNNPLSKLAKSFTKSDELITKIGFREFFKGNPVCGSLGVIFNKNEALRIGGFDVKMRMSADYDFYVRYCQENDFVILNKELGYYRYHENETFKVGVLESFIEDTFVIRNKYCEFVLPRITKPFYMLAIKLHREVQIRRYEKIFPHFFSSHTLLSRGNIATILAKKINVDLMRVILFVAVSALSLLVTKNQHSDD